MLSELVQHLPQGAVRQSELLSDFFQRSPFDKHGAEGLVTAVIRIGWLREELSAGGVIHDWHSQKMSVGFRRETEEMVTTNRNAVDPNHRRTP
jgi:hypothetical protein